jgi:hypothetical protein
LAFERFEERVGDDGDDEPIDLTDCPPSNFSTIGSLNSSPSQRVVKDTLCVLEIDAMLAQIYCGFALVVFKSGHNLYSSPQDLRDTGYGAERYRLL